MKPFQPAFKHFMKVQQYMPAVVDLGGGWGATASAARIFERTVTRQ